MNNMRDRVVLRVDGGLKNGRDVILAALMGAEQFGFGTAALVALGCVMARKCHLNTCPVGIATQDPALRKEFQGTPDNIVTFLLHTAEQVRIALSEMGVRSLDEVIGASHLLQVKSTARFPKGPIDFTDLLANADTTGLRPRRAKSPAQRLDPDAARTQTQVLGSSGDLRDLDEIIWRTCAPFVDTLSAKLQSVSPRGGKPAPSVAGVGVAGTGGADTSSDTVEQPSLAVASTSNESESTLEVHFAIKVSPRVLFITARLLQPQTRGHSQHLVST